MGNIFKFYCDMVFNFVMDFSVLLRYYCSSRLIIFICLRSCSLTSRLDEHSLWNRVAFWCVNKKLETLVFVMVIS